MKRWDFLGRGNWHIAGQPSSAGRSQPSGWAEQSWPHQSSTAKPEWDWFWLCLIFVTNTVTLPVIHRTPWRARATYLWDLPEHWLHSESCFLHCVSAAHHPCDFIHGRPDGWSHLSLFQVGKKLGGKQEKSITAWQRVKWSCLRSSEDLHDKITDFTARSVLVSLILKPTSPKMWGSAPCSLCWPSCLIWYPSKCQQQLSVSGLPTWLLQILHQKYKCCTRNGSSVICVGARASMARIQDPGSKHLHCPAQAAPNTIYSKDDKKWIIADHIKYLSF